MVLGSLAMALALGSQQFSTVPRFEYATPLPPVPGVMMDTLGTGVGIAQQLARAKELQARILWIDATANIERYSSEDKIVALVRKIKETGFNTIVFDIKPISGQVVYPSKLAPRLMEWKGKKLPTDFDPLALFIREAKANSIPLYVSLNAFSEGHRMFLVGPGYSRPEQQTILYESTPVMRGSSDTFPVASKVNTVTDGVISVLTRTELVPGPVAGAFAISVRKDGRIVDGFEAGGIGAGIPTVPAGGYVLYGTGEAAEFLRMNAAPGAKISMESVPEFVPISARPEQQYPLMMNINDPAVERYALDIVKEVVTNYDVQGIIYDDRLRYAGMNADFSEISHRKFEAAIGQKVEWPKDVFEWTYNLDLSKGIRPGKYYDQWMAWRAWTIREYVSKVRQLVKTTRPKTQFSAYVGSWYGEYPRIGHNYAATDIDAGFWFLSPNYQKTGTASLFDFLITGAYYKTATVYQAMEQGTSIGSTVESAGTLTNRLVRDQCWTYAGIALSDFKDDPDGLIAALQAACGSTQGVMVFDLSHDIEPMWPVFAQAFSQPRSAPHTRPDVLSMVRERRTALDQIGSKDPPIIIAAGSAGTGQ